MINKAEKTADIFLYLAKVLDFSFVDNIFKYLDRLFNYISRAKNCEIERQNIFKNRYNK